MNQEKIGKFIFELRKEKNMTQQELADKVGVTDRAISNWENGRRLPDYSILIKLCEELNISINELLSGERISKEDYSEKAEKNLKFVLKNKEDNKKKFRKRMWIVYIITTILSILSIFLIQLDSLRNIILFIIILSLAFIANTVNIIAIALNNNSLYSTKYSVNQGK